VEGKGEAMGCLGGYLGWEDDNFWGWGRNVSIKPIGGTKSSSERSSQQSIQYRLTRVTCKVH